MTQPYALAADEGRVYEWHGVLFTMKMAAAETGGTVSLWEVVTRPGEEPQTHVHEEDEIFYVLEGAITFQCGDQSFAVRDRGFAFLPRGIPHSYKIESHEVRLLGLSVRRPDRADRHASEAGPGGGAT